MCSCRFDATIKVCSECPQHWLFICDEFIEASASPSNSLEGRSRQTRQYLASAMYGGVIFGEFSILPMAVRLKGKIARCAGTHRSIEQARRRVAPDFENMKRDFTLIIIHHVKNSSSAEEVSQVFSIKCITRLPSIDDIHINLARSM